ncbi:hypothetical protein MC885_000389 [Smutsia gigantea]|nr:hypothetical protein MC885_000389 [Smutsia gigantea]
MGSPHSTRCAKCSVFFFPPAESCAAVPPVDNSIFVAKEVEGQILGTYLCIKGFHLVGEKTLFCNASEQWNASAPTCHLGHCPDPVLVNGEFSSSGPVHVRDKITFKCNEPYILKGSDWSQCLENHTWVPPFPVCRSRDCGPPENPAHGYFEGSDFSSGSTITYYCEERYRLVGAKDHQCVDGEWDSGLPLAFQESKELCQATEIFMQRLKDNGLTMEKLKYFLQIKKAELEEKMLPRHGSCADWK